MSLAQGEEKEKEAAKVGGKGASMTTTTATGLGVCALSRYSFFGLFMMVKSVSESWCVGVVGGDLFGLFLLLLEVYLSNGRKGKRKGDLKLTCYTSRR